MSAFVRVLAARWCGPEEPATAIADVELDAALVVRGVQVVDDPIVGSVAVAPRRPWGDQARVLAWSPNVSARIVDGIRSALGDTRAFVGPAELQLRRLEELFPGEPIHAGRPEATIPSAELPTTRSHVRTDPDELAALVGLVPGLTLLELCDRTGASEASMRRHTAALEAAGRIRHELDGRTWRYYPVEVASS